MLNQSSTRSAVRISFLRIINVYLEDILRLISERLCFQGEKAARHQASTRKQQYRERDLTYHQTVTQELVPPARTRAAAALLHRIGKVAVEGRDGRRQAEADGGDER